MDFGYALSLALKIGTGRKVIPPELEDAEKISWGYAILGIVLLAIVQTGLFVFSGLDARMFTPVLLIVLITLGAPFLIYLATAMITGLSARLPASYFYLGVILAILQMLSLVANSISVGSTFLLVLTIALVTTGARGFFKLGMLGSVVVGVAMTAVMLGVGFVVAQMI